MAQTSYTQNLAIGRAGMLADNGPRNTVSRNNQTSGSAVIPFGCAVVQGTNDNECSLPASATDVTGQGKLLGVALIDLSVENKYPDDGSVPSYPSGRMVAVLQKGRCFVTVEENVTPASPVYVRFATDGASNTQPGSFRASAEGTAQVDTVTPTAVNSTQYFVTVSGASGERTYEVTSSGSATAATIVTQFLAIMASDADVTASGTSTLILTAKVAGAAFTTTVDSNQAVAHTTANVATAAKVPNAAYRTTATAGNVAVVELNLP